MNNTYLLLLKRKELLNQFRQDAIKRLSKLKYKGTPECHVRINIKRNQSYIVYKGEKKRETYVSSNNLCTAKQVATYDYLNDVVKQIDEEIKLIDRSMALFTNDSPESYYSTLCQGRRNLITPIRPTDEQFVEAWLAEPYEGGSFSLQDPEFYTEKNERVRSKSEILIANAMCKFKVPYKYECPLYLEGLGVIHPDFTALNVKRRKVLYWEHLGKMDDEEYARTNVNRINIYEKNGVFKGDRLILTWETSKTPLDVKLVEQTIKHYLLE